MPVLALCSFLVFNAGERVFTKNWALKYGCLEAQSIPKCSYSFLKVLGGAFTSLT